MKKRTLVFSLLTILIFIGDLALAVPVTQKAGPKQITPQRTQKEIEQAEDIGVIKQKMSQLGFQVGKITKLRDGSYLIRVNNFRPKTKALSQRGTFKPFTVKARVVRGKIYLKEADFMKERFVVSHSYLPRGIEFEKAEAKIPPAQFERAPRIWVLYPNGGETWEKGRPYNIRWRSEGVSGNVKILLKWGAGSGGWYTVAEGTPNSGAYRYEVPRTGIGHEGDQFKIYVMTPDRSVEDASDRSFSVFGPPSLRVVYPTGGQVWNPGNAYTIRWESQGNIEHVRIWLDERGFGNYIITSMTENTGSFRLQLPSDIHSGHYQVSIGTLDNSTIADSDGYVEIFQDVDLECGLRTRIERVYGGFYGNKLVGKNFKFIVSIKNNGTRRLSNVLFNWVITKNNVVIEQSGAGFGTMYPRRTYEAQFAEVRIDRSEWRNRYEVEVFVDPDNRQGEPEALRDNNKVSSEFSFYE